ncbi:GlxA family transcriptional regulator [Halomonas binhaiensis]|uniref:GlxA family transcriptional regulator n=1 Tax=Halomonas binhaiensis TaxID=2562282 RepID=A0A5C1NPE3_9GAMM|nr:GlxA family transcriptional regulator [Halomonas binhaiensis]QEM84115.1 GlxA family transcriptional regulator [Halomonas binhaiensis]
MRLQPHVPAPESIGFLLLPRFAMVAFFSAIEPLRIANRISGQTLFQWEVISKDGAPVTASNDMTLAATWSLHDAPMTPSLAVCASFSPENAIDAELVEWLNARANAGCMLGGMDTGCFVLAAAGLLNEQTVTLHWESLPEFRERFPDIEAVESLYEVSAEGFSCAGGSSAIDMSLDLIARRHGTRLASLVREQLIHDQGRLPASRQRYTPVSPCADPMLDRAIALMEMHLEAPLSIQALANELGLSWRGLERLFERYLGQSPLHVYRERRLSHAHQLLLETRHGVMDIALASGFASASSFTRAFRQRYLLTPRQLRQHYR